MVMDSRSAGWFEGGVLSLPSLEVKTARGTSKAAMVITCGFACIYDTLSFLREAFVCRRGCVAQRHGHGLLRVQCSDQHLKGQTKEPAPAGVCGLRGRIKWLPHVHLMLVSIISERWK